MKRTSFWAKPLAALAVVLLFLSGCLAQWYADPVPETLKFMDAIFGRFEKSEMSEIDEWRESAPMKDGWNGNASTRAISRMIAGAGHPPANQASSGQPGRGQTRAHPQASM
jgi:hypothetical protein